MLAVGRNSIGDIGVRIDVVQSGLGRSVPEGHIMLIQVQEDINIDINIDKTTINAYIRNRKRTIINLIK